MEKQLENQNNENNISKSNIENIKTLDNFENKDEKGKSKNKKTEIAAFEKTNFILGILIIIGVNALITIRFFSKENLLWGIIYTGLLYLGFFALVIRILIFIINILVNLSKKLEKQNTKKYVENFNSKTEEQTKEINRAEKEKRKNKRLKIYFIFMIIFTLKFMYLSVIQIYNKGYINRYVNKNFPGYEVEKVDYCYFTDFKGVYKCQEKDEVGYNIIAEVKLKNRKNGEKTLVKFKHNSYGLYKEKIADFD